MFWLFTLFYLNTENNKNYYDQMILWFRWMSNWLLYLFDVHEMYQEWSANCLILSCSSFASVIFEEFWIESISNDMHKVRFLFLQVCKSYGNSLHSYILFIYLFIIVVFAARSRVTTNFSKMCWLFKIGKQNQIFFEIDYCFIGVLFYLWFINTINL